MSRYQPRPLPRRGEIWTLEMDMAAGNHPAVVLSAPFGDDERALVTLVIRTRSMRNTKYEVEITPKGFDRGAFDAQNIITVDKSKCLVRRGYLNADELKRVEDAVKAWLCLI